MNAFEQILLTVTNFVFSVDHRVYHRCVRCSPVSVSIRLNKAITADLIKYPILLILRLFLTSLLIAFYNLHDTLLFCFDGIGIIFIVWCYLDLENPCSTWKNLYSLVNRQSGSGPYKLQASMISFDFNHIWRHELIYTDTNTTNCTWKNN